MDESANGHERGGGRVLGLLWGQRARPLWIVPVGLLVVFAAFRAGLLIADRQSLGSVGAAEILRCFLVGTRFDAVPIAYAMIPLVLTLTLAPNLAFPRRWFRRTVAAYAAGILALVLLVEITGMYFYFQFGARLNWIALDYAGHFEEAAAVIWGHYPVWIALIAVFGGFYGFYRLFRRLFGRGVAPGGRVWPRPIAAILLTGCCVLAARGSVGRHPLRYGPAYFCRNRAINQLSLNNFFTLANAAKSHLTERRDLAEDHPFPPMEMTWRMTRQMLRQDGETFLDAKGNPLWRRTYTSRPRQDYNVVVVVMEGMAGRPVGALGHRPTHTPRFDALCRKGLFFERMYAVGERTSRGLVAVLCGHPDLGGKSLIKRSRTQGGFLTLPGIFRRRGYRTLYFYGGSPDFDNMQGFFGAGGVDTFFGGAQMDARGLTTEWGAHDEVVFHKAHDTFIAQAGRKFFAVILTLSNHEPYDVPAGRTELLPTDTLRNKRLNGYRYADWAVGRFFELASRAAYFRRTIFVLVSDHGRKMDRSRLFDVPGYRVPCLIYAPGIVPAGRITAVAGQTDIPPTLLALLGGSYEHCFLGRNVPAVATGRGFAFLREDQQLAFVQGDRAIVLPPGRRSVLFRVGPDTMQPVPPAENSAEVVHHLQLQMLSYFSAARSLYFKSAFRRPQP